MLVSPEDSPDNNGWGQYDEEFWMPLLFRPISLLPHCTFGQLVQGLFPNMKYIVCLSAPIKATNKKKASILRLRPQHHPKE